MPRSLLHRSSGLSLALFANAAAFGLLAVALLLRGGSDGWRDLPSILPLASAQNQPPIAGGAGVFVMPAQLSANAWGVYLLDVDSQTLAAYQYLPSQRQLQLVAARTYRFDRGLQNFNTAAPSPREVEELLKMEDRVRRGNAPGTGAGTESGNPGTPPPSQP